MKTYHFLSRIISLSGDVESNLFPTNRYCKSVPFISPTNSVSLLKFRLSQLSKTAVDAGGGGDCVFEAVSQQLYGNPKNHFYVHIDHSDHPEQFIEHSCQGFIWKERRVKEHGLMQS